VDDIRPYAQELVDSLNATLQPNPDPDENQKLFANQLVASSIMSAMVDNGWVNAPVQKQKSVVSGKQWYEGGTLHNKSAIEWQSASDENKLATCADFIAELWKGDNLTLSIACRLTSEDDIRPYAQALVDSLNATFQPNPDPGENKKLFASQRVAFNAAITMATKGWVRLNILTQKSRLSAPPTE